MSSLLSDLLATKSPVGELDILSTIHWPRVTMLAVSATVSKKQSENKAKTMTPEKIDLLSKTL